MAAIDKKRPILRQGVVPRPLREELAARGTDPMRRAGLRDLLRKTNELAGLIMRHDAGEFSYVWEIDNTHKGRITFEICEVGKKEVL